MSDEQETVPMRACVAMLMFGLTMFAIGLAIGTTL